MRRLFSKSTRLSRLYNARAALTTIWCKSIIFQTIRYHNPMLSVWVFLKCSSFTALYIKSKSSLLKVKLINTSSCVFKCICVLPLGEEGTDVANCSISVALFLFLTPKVSVYTRKNNREHLLLFFFLIISLDTK